MESTTVRSTVMMYSHSSQVRRVRLNATHPAKPAPSWYGDSIGHYEGETLIVDTVGIAVAPLSTDESRQLLMQSAHNAFEKLQDPEIDALNAVCQ